MIKKVEKSFMNPYGIEETSPSFVKPCIIGIFPELENKKMLDGYLNKILYLLQIRHFDDVDSNYDITNIPFDIYANTVNDKDTYKKLIDLIPSDDIATAKKMLRNINIFSYCNGHTYTARIINEIYNGLLKKGYTEQNVQEIMKNIFVLQIVDNYMVNQKNTKIPYVTSIIIHDVDDFENINHQDLGVKLFKFIKYKNHDVLLGLYKSFGESSLSKKVREHNFTDDYIYAPIINVIMSVILINAIESSLLNTNLDLKLLIKNTPNIIKKATEYINNNKKSRDDYTKNDLIKMNEYLMQLIKGYCSRGLSLSLLSDEIKNKLNMNDSIINEYRKNNNLIHIDSLKNDIIKTITSIIDYNDNYDKTEILKIHGNISKYMSVEEIITERFTSLVTKINEYIECLSSIKLPQNVTAEMEEKFNKSIVLIFDELRKELDNEKFKNVCAEYMIDTTTFKI